jgi:hypothetical protein
MATWNAIGPIGEDEPVCGDPLVDGPDRFQAEAAWFVANLPKLPTGPFGLAGGWSVCAATCSATIWSFPKRLRDWLNVRDEVESLRQLVCLAQLIIQIAQIEKVILQAEGPADLD